MLFAFLLFILLPVMLFFVDIGQIPLSSNTLRALRAYPNNLSVLSLRGAKRRSNLDFRAFEIATAFQASQ